MVPKDQLANKMKLQVLKESFPFVDPQVVGEAFVQAGYAHLSLS